MSDPSKRIVLSAWRNGRCIGLGGSRAEWERDGCEVREMPCDQATEAHFEHIRMLPAFKHLSKAEAA